MEYGRHDTGTETRGSGQAAGLRPAFTPLAIWALSIGTSVGWGSFIVTCNTYLEASGLLGTVFGLLIGMAAMLIITMNLAAMVAEAPDAGGVYAFERRVGGKDLGFLAFWFVLITYLAILWANITSLPLFARFFLGDTFRFGLHYEIFGYEVWLGEVLLSLLAILLVGLLCAKSLRAPVRIVVVAALVFVVGLAACALVVVFRHEDAFSFEPLFTEGSSALAQTVRIATFSPWAFIGFENVSHFAEEYTFDVRRLSRILVVSVVATTAFYLLVSFLSVSAYPPEYESWLAYIQDMGNLSGIKAVPVFYVADHYLGGVGVAVLLVVLFCVILTSLVGNLLALSRLLYAAGREGDAPSSLKVLNGHGIPDRAILTVVALSVLIPLVGRTAIGWIVDVTTLCATLIYGLISHAVFLSARREQKRPQAVLGAAGMVLMACLVALLLVPGLLPSEAMATESYFLFITWSILGLVYYRTLVKRDRSLGHEKGIVVWIVLLVLVLFAAMMWVSRATEEAADQAVEQIVEYHQSHPGYDAADDERAERTRYLQGRARQISGTNTLYSVVSLGVMLFSILILGDSLRQNSVLGRQLNAAEREAQAAREIAELKESINALLDNMPLMSYSKDARDGTYLACNHAFAEFARRETPEEVVGLTDADLFDPETAAYFAEVDQRALTMDVPYVLDEDVLDVIGNQRHLQTTRLKFTDTNGRLCLLGMSTDVTEVERIRLESERAQAAYREAAQTSSVYESMVDALTEDYFNLFYVDLKTNDYIEYGSRTEAGQRTQESRGHDFFASCKTDAQTLVFEADRQTFVDGLEKERLLGEIAAHGTFIMQYRLNIDGKPTYVSLKATISSTDERYMVIGVNNIDSQVHERAEALKAREERQAYARISALSGNVVALYLVDPKAGSYAQYSASEGFASLGFPAQGEDFIAAMAEEGASLVDPKDLELYKTQVTRDCIREAIASDGVFSLDYRMAREGLPTYVRLRVATVVEDGRPMLVVGLLDEDAQMQREHKYARDLSQAQQRATKDQLTGVRNKHAYADTEAELIELVKTTDEVAFAIIVCDINDLKKVNDTLGHQAGDQYIKDACAIICTVFKRSPVFRIGGDEFCVISRGHDYDHLEDNLRAMEEHNAEAKGTGGVQIACGAARYERGLSVGDVFERADRSMYDCKTKMKSGEGGVVR